MGDLDVRAVVKEGGKYFEKKEIQIQATIDSMKAERAKYVLFIEEIDAQLIILEGKK